MSNNNNHGNNKAISQKLSEIKQNTKTNPTVTPLANEETQKIKVVRGPFYLFSTVLLLGVTAMVFTAYFTNNWQTTYNTNLEYYQNQMREYVTNGLWFTCRHVKIDWIPDQSDVYCGTYNFAQSKFFT